jgi:hypothetical protein
MDPTLSTGLYQFTWDSGAPVGSTNTGNFILSGEFCDSDPTVNLNAVCNAIPDLSAPYSVTATAPVGAIPEPATLLMTATGLSALALMRKRHQPS